MADVLQGLARAKVNLVLEVLGTRPDGYHEIDTILQEVELADVVTLSAAREWSVSVSGPHAAGTPADASNLAMRAGLRLAEVAAVSPFAIHLEKRIPAAGGLGGGASDAATVMRLLQGALPQLSDALLLQVANELGSDEAFFLVGSTARARGRGEWVTALPPLPPHDVVLFVPPETIERKTPRMFSALDRHPFDSGAVATDFAATTPLKFDSAMVFNAFERVAFELFPSLGRLWEDLEARIGEPVRLAGAGPCLFWIGPTGRGAAVAAAARGAACEVVATRTVTRE